MNKTVPKLHVGKSSYTPPKYRNGKLKEMNDSGTVITTFTPVVADVSAIDTDVYTTEIFLVTYEV